MPLRSMSDPDQDFDKEVRPACRVFAAHCVEDWSDLLLREAHLPGHSQRGPEGHLGVQGCG